MIIVLSTDINRIDVSLGYIHILGVVVVGRGPVWGVWFVTCFILIGFTWDWCSCVRLLLAVILTINMSMFVGGISVSKNGEGIGSHGHKPSFHYFTTVIN